MFRVCEHGLESVRISVFVYQCMWVCDKYLFTSLLCLLSLQLMFIA